MPPVGVAQAFLGVVEDALESLLLRWARHHGPFLAAEPAARWGVRVPEIEAALERLVAAGSLLRGEFRPAGVEREWCHPDVLRQLRRRSLAKLRREVEPVEPRALGRFLPRWQGIAERRGGTDRLAEVIAQLEGTPLPASVLERDVLPARVAGYSPRLLDELGAAGEVVWVGLGPLGKDDGRIALYRPDRLALLLLQREPSSAPEGWLHDALREHLRTRGAAFYRDLLATAMRRRRRASRAPGARARAARRGVGSRLGDRGDQRHVRPAARAALAAPRIAAPPAADGHRRAWGRPRRPAAGRW